MIDKPIRTIEQAKEYYKAMGCSHFHLDREDKERAQEYYSLKISKKSEAAWTEEQFNEFYLYIIEGKKKDLLWSIHARMNDLFEQSSTNTGLTKMLEVTKILRDKVPPRERVLVAETINGRKQRKYHSGLIYSAYNLHKKLIAKEFVELSLYFAKYNGKNIRHIERCQDVIDLCNEIKLELGL
jgi:hypothetical protein